MAINLRKLLEGVVRVNASDMHLKVGLPPMIRLNGGLHPVEHPALLPEDTEEANEFMMPDRCRAQLERDGTSDYSYGLNPMTRFRVNCYHQRGVKSLAIRRIVSEKKGFADLGLPEALVKLSTFQRGLVLVTGITGSGKSSTLAAVLHQINANRREHIITIEDPIEIVYQDEKCIIDQVEVNQDVVDFKCALRHALRQDPDIILIGEMRDRETVQTAMHCVETGHLVFSTLHTTDARQTVVRICQFFPKEEHYALYEQIARNLQAVVCQRLLKAAGNKGRVPCCEVMFNTPVVFKLISEARIDDLLIALRSREEGMMSFDQHLVDLVKSERIEMEEALRAVEDPAAFRRALKGIVAGTDGAGLIG